RAIRHARDGPRPCRHRAAGRRCTTQAQEAAGCLRPWPVLRFIQPAGSCDAGQPSEEAMSEKLYAMVSAQGTACDETVLTEQEYNNPAMRRAAESRARHTAGADAPIAGSWVDVSDNEACRARIEC